MVQKVFGIREQVKCCKPEQMGTKESGRLLKRIQTLEEGRGPSQRNKELKNRVRKEKNYEKGVSEAFRQV